MWVFDPRRLRIRQRQRRGACSITAIAARASRHEALDLWPEDEWELHREVARTIGDTYHSDRTWRHIKADGSEIEVLTYARRVPFDGRDGRSGRRRRHHRAQAGRGAHRLYGASRRADRSAQPRAVPGASRTNCSARRAAGTASASRCFASISIISRTSTIRSAIRSATAAEARRRAARAQCCATAIWSRGSAATSSRSCSFRMAESRTKRATLGDDADRGRQRLTRSTATRSSSAPASASRCRRATATRRRADAQCRHGALPRQGRRPRHRAFFEPEMDRRIQARRMLELDLRKAFANGEFELHYQPLINLQADADQRLRGAAALAASRARHDLAGAISFRSPRRSG